jgi:hypothetical protein
MSNTTKFQLWIVLELYKLCRLMGQAAEHYGYPE